MSARTTAIDARVGLTVVILPQDIKGAVCGSPTECVLAKAIRRTTKALSVEVFKNILYVHHKKHSIRYQISQPAKLGAFLFDETGKFGMDLGRTSINKDHPAFDFDPPRPATSLKKLRSEEFKLARKVSRDKNLNKPKRQYNKPDPFTVHSQRNGTGKVKDPYL